MLAFFRTRPPAEQDSRAPAQLLNAARSGDDQAWSKYLSSRSPDVGAIEAAYGYTYSQHALPTHSMNLRRYYATPAHDAFEAYAEKLVAGFCSLTAVQLKYPIVLVAHSGELALAAHELKSGLSTLKDFINLTQRLQAEPDYSQVTARRLWGLRGPYHVRGREIHMEISIDRKIDRLVMGREVMRDHFLNVATSLVAEHALHDFLTSAGIVVSGKMFRQLTRTEGRARDPIDVLRAPELGKILALHEKGREVAPNLDPQLMYLKFYREPDPLAALKKFAAPDINLATTSIAPAGSVNILHGIADRTLPDTNREKLEKLIRELAPSLETSTVEADARKLNNALAKKLLGWEQIEDGLLADKSAQTIIDEARQARRASERGPTEGERIEGLKRRARFERALAEKDQSLAPSHFEFQAKDGSIPYREYMSGILQEGHRSIIERAVSDVSDGKMGKTHKLHDTPDLWEIRIFEADKFRVYFTYSKDGKIVLLNGGTKKTQDEDWPQAALFVAEYKETGKHAE